MTTAYSYCIWSAVNYKYQSWDGRDIAAGPFHRVCVSVCCDRVPSVQIAKDPSGLLRILGSNRTLAGRNSCCGTPFRIRLSILRYAPADVLGDNLQP